MQLRTEHYLPSLYLCLIIFLVLYLLYVCQYCCSIYFCYYSVLIKITNINICKITCMKCCMLRFLYILWVFVTNPKTTTTKKSSNEFKKKNEIKINFATFYLFFFISSKTKKYFNLKNKLKKNKAKN